MATVRPFAYNPNSGTTYTGTTQIGNIAVATVSNFLSIGLQWYMGPDEDLGYVVAYPYQSTRPQFWRSKEKTDSSFIDLCRKQFKQVFSTGADAKTWLNNNGYWTSYVSSSPSLVQVLQLNVGDGTWNTPQVNNWSRWCQDDTNTNYSTLTNSAGTSTGWSISRSGSVLGSSEGVATSATNFPADVLRYTADNQDSITVTLSGLNNSYKYTIKNLAETTRN